MNPWISILLFWVGGFCIGIPVGIALEKWRFKLKPKIVFKSGGQYVPAPEDKMIITCFGGGGSGGRSNNSPSIGGGGSGSYVPGQHDQKGKRKT